MKFVPLLGNLLFVIISIMNRVVFFNALFFLIFFGTFAQSDKIISPTFNTPMADGMVSFTIYTKMIAVKYL